MYASLQSANPGFRLNASEIQGWGYSLFADGHLNEAIEIMKLGIQIEPSALAHASVGDAYRQSGQRQQAIDSYKAALAKEPNNFVIKEKLQQVGADERPTR